MLRIHRSPCELHTEQHETVFEKEGDERQRGWNVSLTEEREREWNSVQLKERVLDSRGQESV